MGLLDTIGMGQIIDTGLDIWKQDRAESQQDHAQNFSAAQAAEQRTWSANQAQLQRDWQEKMSGSAYQRSTRDMMKAGLNPMLAYHQGGASTPSGGVPSGASASGTAGSTPGLHRQQTIASALTAQQISNAQAEERRTDADTERLQAERDEIRARTPTHAVHIDRMQQDIRESIERIQKLHQDIKVGQSTAAHLDQQVRNLQESIPQIRASTNQLRTLANLNEAQAIERLTASGLNEAHAKEVHQRVKQDLPDLERQLKNLERIAMQMQQPGHAADEAAKDSFIGQLGAYLRALLPLGGLVGAIPIGRAGGGTVTPGPIHRGTGGNPTIHRR